MLDVYRGHRGQKDGREMDLNVLSALEGFLREMKSKSLPKSHGQENRKISMKVLQNLYLHKLLKFRHQVCSVVTELQLRLFLQTTKSTN